MALKYLTNEQIRKLTFNIKTLDQSQREIVRDLLSQLQRGGIGKLELQRELRRLRAGRAISEIDRRAIEAAVFGQD